MSILTYDQFRTGLIYHDVYMMIWNRKHKRRNGVLGYWRELKQRMYADYLEKLVGVDETHHTLSEDPISE